MKDLLVDYDGKEVQIEDIGEQISRKYPNTIKVVASDMDHTMFDQDLGVLVFIEKLFDPNFWEFEPNFFKKLLLPREYRNALEKGEDRSFPGLDPKICRVALNLCEDIGNLYEFQRKFRKSNSGNDDLVIEEFARKMIEFDSLFLRMDPVLSQHFKDQLLMRTRFFAGKFPNRISEITEKVMERTENSADKFKALGIFEVLKKEANQIVTEADLTEIHQGKSPYQEINRVVSPIVGIQKSLRFLVEQAGFAAVVVTANLEGIAKTAMKSQEYDFIRNQQRLNPAFQPSTPLVIGSRLLMNGSSLATQMDGVPVHGITKAIRAKEYAKELKGEFIMAKGDSPTTDGPMLLAALKNGGPVVIVGDAFGKTHKKFANVLRPAIEADSDIRTRIFFNLTGNH